MIKKMAWDTFKNTGNIDTFLELMQVEEAEKDLEMAEALNGLSEDKGNNINGEQYRRF